MLNALAVPCHDGAMEPAASPPEPTGRRRRRARWRPEQGIGWGEGGRLTTRQRVVPVLAVLVLAGTLVYGVVPFEVAGALECKGALRGAEPAADAPGAIVGDPKRACRDAGNSRRATAAVIAVAAAVLGVAGLLLPPDIEEEPDGEPGEAETA